MVFEISYMKKLDSADPRSKFARSFYIQHDKVPSREGVEALVKRVSEGDFGPQSIQIEEYRLFAAESLKKVGMPVYQLELG